MGDTQDSTLGQDPIASAKLDKLHLEIENLRKKNRWESLSPLIPIFASGVTVIALVIGFFEFQRQQEQLQNKIISDQTLERTTKLQAQLRGDVDELLRQDKSQTVSRVSFLLKDIGVILTSKVQDDKTVADLNPKYNRSITESLVAQIVNDSDFINNPKDVAFATKIAEQWPDYQIYLKENDNNLQQLDRVLNRYVQALLNLRKTKETFLNGLCYDEATAGYQPTGEVGTEEVAKNLFPQFFQLQKGFMVHFEFVRNDKGTKARAIKQQNVRDFEIALCNENVAKHILGEDFGGYCGVGKSRCPQGNSGGDK
jgi:hypothetical protein